MNDLAFVIDAHAAGRAQAQAAQIRRTQTPRGELVAPGVAYAPPVEQPTPARSSVAQHRFDTIGLPRHAGDWS